MYDFKSRVTYSEINSEKEMTLPAIVDSLQNCCSFQSEDMGIGVDYLKENHAAWVLSAWEIVIERCPKFAEQIVTSTWPYDFKGFCGYRNFTIRDEAGIRCVIANSVWAYMDTETMRPRRLDEKVLSAYVPVIEPQIAYEWSGRKIHLEGEPVFKEPIPVQKYYIDTNHHMNNGKYILLAEEFLPEGFETERIRVEYKKAAMLGDILYPAVYNERDGVTIVLADKEQKPYAIMQFKRKDTCLN